MTQKDKFDTLTWDAAGEIGKARRLAHDDPEREWNQKARTLREGIEKLELAWQVAVAEAKAWKELREYTERKGR